MALEITGELHIIGDTTAVSERFTKREFVVKLTDNPKYPQLVQFQLTGDRCAQLDAFEVGDRVTLEFSLRGREWRSPKGEVRFFNSLDVWRVEPAAVGSKPQPKGGQGAPPKHRERRAAEEDGPPAPSGSAGNEEDDCPF